MDAGQTVPVDGIESELTDRQRDVLDFERTWWQFDESRDELIRARFGCRPDEYDAELDDWYSNTRGRCATIRSLCDASSDAACAAGGR